MLFEKYAKPLFKNGIKVLEIGPDVDRDVSTLKKSVADDSIIWETVDIISSKNLTHVAESEYKFPMADNTYDIVLSCNVLEHVRKPWVWVKEVSRVCKKN